MADDTRELVEREMLAVMMTDVHGFTTAVSAREESVEQRLLTDLDRFRKIVTNHGGIVIADRGDGIKATFKSPVRCFQAAIQMQEYSFQQNAAAETGEIRLRHRIGLHVGDTVSQANHVGGVVVAIAARLEQMCPPGKICFSHELHQMTQSEIRIHRVSLGSEDFKNLSRTVKVWVAQIGGDLDFDIPRPRTQRVAVGEVVTEGYRNQYRKGILNGIAIVVCLALIGFGSYEFWKKKVALDLYETKNNLSEIAQKNQMDADRKAKEITEKIKRAKESGTSAQKFRDDSGSRIPENRSVKNDSPAKTDDYAFPEPDYPPAPDVVVPIVKPEPLDDSSATPSDTPPNSGDNSGQNPTEIPN